MCAFYWKCVHFENACILCKLDENAHILCKLDENAGILLKMCAFYWKCTKPSHRSQWTNWEATFSTGTCYVLITVEQKLKSYLILTE